MTSLARFAIQERVKICKGNTGRDVECPTSHPGGNTRDRMSYQCAIGFQPRLGFKGLNPVSHGAVRTDDDDDDDDDEG